MRRSKRLTIYIFSLIVSIQALYSATDTIKVITPTKAVIYSAIFPGLGQLYVHQPLKAGIYVGLEGYHFYQFLYYTKMFNKVEKTQNLMGRDVWVRLSELQKRDSVFAYTGYRLPINTWRVREKRNKYAWWCIGIYLLNILDAYVDAHLYYFPKGEVELSFLPNWNQLFKPAISCSITWRF